MISKDKFKIDIIVKNIFSAVFSFIIGYITVIALFWNNEIRKINIFNDYKLLILVIGISIYLYLIITIFKNIIKNSNSKKYNKLIIIMSFIALVLQFLIAYFGRVKSMWDLEVVLSAASGFKDGISISSIDYLYMYTNNIPITYFLSLVFRICNFFGVKCFYEIAILINIIFIDLAVYISYLTAKKIFGNKKALIVLLLLMTFTPIYTYVPIPYTDTMSMIFPILILYMYILSREVISRKKICLYILIGLAAGIGMMFKPTVLIILIAIIIYSIIYEKNKINIMSIIIIPLSIIGTLLLAKTMFISKVFDNVKLNKESFPVEHWIMMGLSNKGMYEENDVIYTKSFSGKENKKEADIAEIKKRLKEMDFKDTITHINNKLCFTYGDGTYYAPNKLGRFPIKRNLLHEFLLQNGKYVYIYKYYSQIQQISILILIFISSISMFNKKTNNLGVCFILNLSIFGVILFFGVWETRSRYLVNYIPILIMSATYGIDFIYDIMQKRLYLKPEEEKNERNI